MVTSAVPPTCSFCAAGLRDVELREQRTGVHDGDDR